MDDSGADEGVSWMGGCEELRLAIASQWKLGFRSKGEEEMQDKVREKNAKASKHEEGKQRIVKGWLWMSKEVKVTQSRGTNNIIIVWSGDVTERGARGHP